MNKHIVSAALALAFSGWAITGSAVSTSSMTVTVTVLSKCNVTAPEVAAMSGDAVISGGTAQPPGPMVTCTQGVPFDVRMGAVPVDAPLAADAVPAISPVQGLANAALKLNAVFRPGPAGPLQSVPNPEADAPLPALHANAPAPVLPMLEVTF